MQKIIISFTKEVEKTLLS